MSISSTFDRLHSQAKRNSWLWLFSIFCRLALALGFIPAAIVKLIDERFASGLHANHPMGHYLEALHLTGYYYTFIGVVQLFAAIMLLIPRTATLGAFLYFPVILNITVLTFATRFDGSLFTAPLMTLANLYVLGWNYEKWKYILPFNDVTKQTSLESDVYTQETVGQSGVFSRYKPSFVYARFINLLKQLFSTKFPFLEKFPFLFFAGVFAAIVFFMIIVPGLYSIRPRNTLTQCLNQFKDKRTEAGENFCNCIHTNGDPLNKCLNEYNNAPKVVSQIP